MKRLIALLALLSMMVPQTAFAGTATLTVIDGQTPPQVQHLGQTTDANGYYYAGQAIVDGAAAAYRATVKAPGTAPQVADDALVVAISPNTPTLPVSIASLPSLPAGSNTIGAVTQSGSWSVAVSSCSGCASSNGSISNTGSAVPSQATYLGASVGGTLTGLGATANGLKVDGSAVTQPVSISGNQAVNVAQFGGTNVVTGTGASGSGIPRVTISNDSSLAANQSVNNSQWGGTNVVTGGVAGSVGSGGLAASGASVSGNPLYQGCRAQNAEPTAVSNGQAVGAACDLVGKRIVMPYANKENFLAGENTQTSTTATTLIAAQGVGVKIYVTGISCGNTGATTSTIALNNTEADGHSWTLVNPAGGGFVKTFAVPLVVAANTALTFTPGSASTTQVCSAEGYAGT